MRSIGALLADAGEGELLHDVEGREPGGDAGLLVDVAAEMLVGGTGIGYFVWNEWNNLSITNVITSILLIGVVGMILDQLLARAQRLVTFPE